MGAVQAKGVPSMHDLQATPPKTVSMNKIPVRVENIHVKGIGRTHGDIVKQQLQNIFVSKDFQELVVRSNEAKIKLEKLGLFKNVDILIDTSKGDKSTGEAYDVTFKVKETRKFGGGISTLIGNNDGSMVINVKLPNTLGRGEVVNAEVKMGKKENGADIVFSKPLFGNPDTRFQAGGFIGKTELPWANNTRIERGFTSHILSRRHHQAHRISWTGVWRELIPTSKGNNIFEARETSGHDIKSSVKYTYTYDNRDCRILPNKGLLFEKSWEYAGLGGNVQYVKSFGELQYNLALPLRSVLQFSLAGGAMKNTSSSALISMNDRFFIGGPLTLRGFRPNAVCQSDSGVSLGANSYWLAGLHLYLPLPFTSTRGGFADFFRTHFFVNGGNLQDIDVLHLKEDVGKLFTNVRWCYGAGVVFKMAGIARLELNYCFPQCSKSDTGMYSGLQFGIGIHFL